MRRSIFNLRTKLNVRALAFGPSVHQESHVLGTTAREEGAVQPNPAATAAGNTAARILARGNALNNFYPKGTTTSIEMMTGKPAKLSDDIKAASY